jgi:hypothetical protein
MLVGHIFGGILSNSLNPFSTNSTSTTSADATIYEVRLIRKMNTSVNEIEGKNPYKIEIFPNPIESEFTVQFSLKSDLKTHYFITNELGQVIQEGDLASKQGKNRMPIKLESNNTAQNLNFTLVIDDKFFFTKKLISTGK